MAQAVSRWLFTAAARLRPHLRSGEIFGGQNGSESGFSRVLQFPVLPVH